MAQVARVTHQVALWEVLGYTWLMDQELCAQRAGQFFLTGNKAGIQPQYANRLRLILAQLQQARTIDDLRIPTLRLHELKGDLKDTWQSPYRLTGASHSVFLR